MVKDDYSYSATFKVPTKPKDRQEVFINDCRKFRLAIGDEVIFDNAPDLPPFVPLSQLRESTDNESSDAS